MNKQIFFAGEGGQPFAAQYGVNISYEGAVNTRAEVIVYQDLGPDSKPATSLHDAAALTYLMQRIVKHELGEVRSTLMDFYLVQNIQEVGLIGRKYQDVPSLDCPHDAISLDNATKLEAGKSEALLQSIGIPVPESFE